jgi:hypothetical protein
MRPGGFSNDIIIGFVGVNNIPLVDILQKDMQTCSTGKYRQDHVHMSLARENSASPSSLEGKETRTMTRELRTTALRKKIIKSSTGLQWDKPPRKAT